MTNDDDSCGTVAPAKVIFHALKTWSKSGFWWYFTDSWLAVIHGAYADVFFKEFGEIRGVWKVKAVSNLRDG